MAPRPKRRAAPPIDVLVQSTRWEKQPASEKTVRKAIETAAASVPAGGEVSVVLTDDAGIRALNKKWRNIDKPTNVLSFPADRPAAPDAPPMLGDIVMAYETLARECEADGKDFHHHLAHLSVHGFLHLMGYDHETESDAESMERLETAILARLGVPDPYLERH